MQIQPFLSGDYTKILHSHTTLKTKFLGIYHRSGTIWDGSEIILIDSVKFFCYYISDIERFCAAGYYRKEADQFVFDTDRKLYKKLKRSIKLPSEKLYYSDDFHMCATLKGDTLTAFR